MIPGPAANIPEFITTLELLIVRGCTVAYHDGANPGEMEVYTIRYARHGSTLTGARLLYPDARGAKQALELLEELNRPEDVYDAMAARYSKEIGRAHV